MIDAFICDAVLTPFGRYALYTLRIDVGQGIAVIIERV